MRGHRPKVSAGRADGPLGGRRPTIAYRAIRGQRHKLAVSEGDGVQVFGEAGIRVGPSPAVGRGHDHAGISHGDEPAVAKSHAVQRHSRSRVLAGPVRSVGRGQDDSTKARRDKLAVPPRHRVQVFQSSGMAGRPVCSIAGSQNRSGRTDGKVDSIRKNDATQVVPLREGIAPQPVVESVAPGRRGPRESYEQGG